MDKHLDDKLRRCKSERERVIRDCSEVADHGSRLLKGFFSSQKEPVDVVVVLEGGLDMMNLLSPYIERTNLLYFRPKRSYLHDVKKPSLKGSPNLEQKVLIYDDDMLTGESLKETRDYLLNLGYSKESIYAYVHLGMYCVEIKPLLGKIDDVLDYQDKNAEEIVKL